MKVSHTITVIELDDEERRQLHSILCIGIELCNEAVRREILAAILTRAGLDNPREAGKMREFADRLSDQL